MRDKNVHTYTLAILTIASWKACYKRRTMAECWSTHKVADVGRQVPEVFKHEPCQVSAGSDCIRPHMSVVAPFLKPHLHTMQCWGVDAVLLTSVWSTAGRSWNRVDHNGSTSELLQPLQTGLREWLVHEASRHTAKLPHLEILQHWQIGKHTAQRVKLRHGQWHQVCADGTVEDVRRDMYFICCQSD
jgi:hypothetical protein